MLAANDLKKLKWLKVSNLALVVSSSCVHSAVPCVSVQKFMKLLSTERRDKILELARRSQSLSPTS